MNAPLLTEALRLPAAERMELAEALWESVETGPAALPVPAWHLAVLEERLREMEAHPEDEVSWEEVRSRLEQLA